MRLPEDNSLTLPADNGWVVDRSDPPAWTVAELLELLPGWVRELDSPVRDTLLAAWRAMLVYAWGRHGQTLAQTATPRHAAGTWLADWGRRLRRPRAVGEDDGTYRARLLNPPDVVSPNAIRAAVDALVAAVTTTRAAYVEPATDGVFCQSAANAADPPWVAWVQSRERRLWGDYPDNPNPYVGAYVVSAAAVPEFWVIVPQGAGDDDAAPFALSAASPLVPDFVAPLVFPGAWASDRARYAAPGPEALTDRVITEVEPRRAGGVRWMLLTDALLASAFFP